MSVPEMSHFLFQGSQLQKLFCCRNFKVALLQCTVCLVLISYSELSSWNSPVRNSSNYTRLRMATPPDSLNCFSLFSVCRPQTLRSPTRCGLLLPSPLPLLSHRGPRRTLPLHERQRRHLGVPPASTRVGVQVRRFAGENCKYDNPGLISLHCK